MTATKIDLTRELKDLYRAPRAPAFVEVPELPFLMIDGHGDPNTSAEFGEAIEALFSVSYTLKFALKLGPQQVDFHVMPLEGLFSVTDMGKFKLASKDDWDWTLMIAQPDQVNDELLEEAIDKAIRKRALPAAQLLRLERFEEGPAAQVMYVGPYVDEGPTIERLHAVIAEQGYELVGRHHEIYLGDPRRAAPEKLKTIIRQPVARLVAQPPLP